MIYWKKLGTMLSYILTVTHRDIRSPQAPRLQYVESHNDDVTEVSQLFAHPNRVILHCPYYKKLLLKDRRPKLIGTQLQYHPTRNNILLSGSTDGLVNIYDTTVTDEDDALMQVINHGSVHHAGFLSESTIFALSHDEQFSIHPATNPDDPGQEPEPVDFDDLREPLGVEYVVQVCMGGQGPYIAAGNKMYVLPILFSSTLLRSLITPSCHSDKRLDLVPLVSCPSWKFDQDNLWRLPGAHGDEVVRSVYLDEQVCFSCCLQQKKHHPVQLSYSSC